MAGITIAGHTVGWLWLLLDALAVYRLAHLITQDSLLEQPRGWVLGRWPPSGARLSMLAVCAWCCSVWIAGVVLALTVYLPAVWVWLAVPLALSAVAGYLSERA